MLRSLIEEFLLFVLPFLAFASYLILRRRNPLDIEHWRAHVFILTVIGLLLAIVSLIVAGMIDRPAVGAFEPAHMENGRLVPGRFDDSKR
jgi:amino acid transporter